MVWRIKMVAGGAAFLGALWLPACGTESSVSEEQRHQERDAELARTLGNAAGEDALNPFAAAQTLAEDSIGAAVASTVDQTWVRKMIEHQEGAARMAQILLNLNPTPEVRRAAERVQQDAHARVETLTKLRESSIGSDAKSAEIFHPNTSEMFTNMTKVQASSVERLWALKMLDYNRGGVNLAGLEVSRGSDDRIRTAARELASALAHEADTLQQLAKQPQ